MTLTPRPFPRRLRTLLTTAGLVAATVAGATAGATVTGASGDTATAATSTVNPLAGGRWGVYTGGADGVYPAWQAATGTNKKLLAKVALRPRVRWFGGWIPSSKIGGLVSDYITKTQAGDPRVLVQMATFMLWPQGEGHKTTPMTLAQRDEYKTWVNHAAAAIGGARVALVLEPDLGLTAPPMTKGVRPTADPAVRQALVRYAAQKFGSLPHTAVYLDSSDADWLSLSKSVTLLKNTGVQYVRGFALGATHYSSVLGNIRYGTALVAALAKAGVPGKHFVIDTADNGQPFTYGQYYAKHPHGDFDNAQTCRTRAEHRCVTLGIPPTWDVANSRWGLPATARAQALAHVDGYLWFGRPWLYRQASPFLLGRTLQVARTTRY